MRGINEESSRLDIPKQLLIRAVEANANSRKRTRAVFQ